MTTRYIFYKFDQMSTNTPILHVVHSYPYIFQFSAYSFSRQVGAVSPTEGWYSFSAVHNAHPTRN